MGSSVFCLTFSDDKNTAVDADKLMEILEARWLTLVIRKREHAQSVTLLI